MDDIRSRRQTPVLMLLLATLFWGMSFSWAKNNADALNRAAGLPTNAELGPVLLLFLRFGAATVLWLACVPESRRGWTWQTTWRGLAVGGTLGVALVLQYLCLGKTDEATAAFLTNLTVLVVPLGEFAVTRRPVRWPVLTAVLLALLGTVLLGGVGRPGPVIGAVYGVGCAVAFAAEILLLDHFGRGESVARMALLTFACPAAVCGCLSATLPGVSAVRWQTLATFAFLQDFVPATLLATLAAFALMTAYQPRVSPTRAAMIYLAEPLFAAAYAWWYNGRGMTRAALAGAALILLANVVAEWNWRRV